MLRCCLDKLVHGYIWLDQSHAVDEIDVEDSCEEAGVDHFVTSKLRPSGARCRAMVYAKRSLLGVTRAAMTDTASLWLSMANAIPATSI